VAIIPAAGSVIQVPAVTIQQVLIITLIQTGRITLIPLQIIQEEDLNVLIPLLQAVLLILLQVEAAVAVEAAVLEDPYVVIN
jgi:hypothetical protein